MVGVITKIDVVSRINKCTDFSCTTAATHAMTRGVTFCRLGDSLLHVWSVSRERGLKNIPVVDEDLKPLGVLNARDALQVLLEDVQYEEQLLRDYMFCVWYR